MHGSNHIGLSVWQWNRGHLLLYESSGCPKLGYSYTFSKPKLSGLRSNHLAWATTLEGFEKSAHFARPLCLLASFPGSPHTQMKNREERREPGKIYHVRNVISRENLIISGRTNELTHALWTEYTRSAAKALWLTERD